MSLQVQHPVADWYLAFDDLWELMRVNWQTHNPFTQSGMWDAGGFGVRGILMVVDSPPYRGVLLQIDTDGEREYIAIVTYGPKCNECGYQPYNALWYPSEGDDPIRDEAIEWGAKTITQMISNAEEGGVERYHNDECSHLTYDEEGAPDE